VSSAPAAFPSFSHLKVILVSAAAAGFVPHGSNANDANAMFPSEPPGPWTNLINF
jgi:hypothetical protein